MRVDFQPFCQSSYQMRLTPYRSKSVSTDTRGRSNARVCAINMRSKGSRCGPGNRPARSPLWTVIGNSWNPLARDAAGNVVRHRLGPRELSKSMRGSDLPCGSGADEDIVLRAGDCGVGGHGQTLVPGQPSLEGMRVEQDAHGTHDSQAANSAFGSGSKKLSSTTNWPFMAPNRRMPGRSS